MVGARPIAVFLPALFVLMSGCVKGTWQEFISSEGRFSVMMPEKPKETYAEKETDLARMQVHTFSNEEFLVLFTVAYVDFPAHPAGRPDVRWEAERIFSVAHEGIMHALEVSTLWRYENVDIGGHPGQTFNSERDKNFRRIKSKLVWVEPRLYQVVAAAYEFPGMSQEENLDRFLNSFKLR